MSETKKIKTSGSSSYIKNVLTPVVEKIVEPSDIIIEREEKNLISKPSFLQSEEDKKKQAEKERSITNERMTRWKSLVEKVVEVISRTIEDKHELLDKERTGRFIKDAHPISVEIAQDLMKSPLIANEIRKKAKSIAAEISDETIIEKLTNKVDSTLDDDVFKKIKEAVAMGTSTNGAKAKIPSKVIVNANLPANSIKLADNNGVITPPANLLVAKTGSTGKVTLS